MTLRWKQILGSVVLSTMAFSIIGTHSALAQNKSDTIKPSPPSVANGKSATIPVELPTVDGSSTEKGIKDAGGCQGCGPVRDHPRPSGGKTGRPKERDDTPRDTSATERQAHNGQVGTPPSTAKPKKKGPKVRDDPIHSTKLRLSLIGGLAGLSAVIAVAASGGDNKPSSP